MMIQFIFKTFFEAMDLILQSVTIVVTICVAVYAYRISKGQFVLQNYQLRHDLYDRRFRIYEELCKGYSVAPFVMGFKEKRDGINSWLSKNKDHLRFLFDDEVFNKAILLKEELEKTHNEGFKEDLDLVISNRIDNIFIELKEDISDNLKFKDLK